MKMRGLVWMSDCLVLVLHCLYVLGTYSDSNTPVRIIMLILFNFQSAKDCFLSSFVLNSNNFFNPETFHHASTEGIFGLN